MTAARANPKSAYSSMQAYSAGWADATARTTGWRRAGLAFLAGSLSVLAMAPFFWSPVLFLTLPIWIWLIDGACARPSNEGQPAARPESRLFSRQLSLRRAALDGWWFGFGYFFFGLFWVGEAFLVEAEVFGWLLPFAVTLMPAGLALFYALSSALASYLWPLSQGVGRIIGLALALCGAEWLRGHILTGFPWNTLGYALTFPLELMQSAGLVGIYGLTLWTVLVFAAPLVVFADAGRTRQSAGPSSDRVGSKVLVDRPSLLITATTLMPLAAMLAYGHAQLSASPTRLADNVRIRLVQPSIAQREKWMREKQAAIFQTHLNLSQQQPDGTRDDLKGITHLIWPEAAMPFLPLDQPVAIEAIGKLLAPGAYLITGALRAKQPSGQTNNAGERRQIYNAMMVFGRGGGLAALYDKIHLVPFGEYLPFQQTLEAIGLQQLTRMRGGFSTGDKPRPLLHVPGLPPIGALICYEAIFPTTIVQGDNRPGVLINVTNDGWFGSTTGPHQHFHQSRVRAVEEGLPLFRAANNGISAVVDPVGRVLHRLELDARGTIDSELPSALAAPLYARFGDIVFIVNALLFLILFIICRQFSALSPLNQRIGGN